eukprot:scaffold325_cov343-Pavlova_lutheri.AAC.21
MNLPFNKKLLVPVPGLPVPVPSHAVKACHVFSDQPAPVHLQPLVIEINRADVLGVVQLVLVEEGEPGVRAARCPPRAVGSEDEHGQVLYDQEFDAKDVLGVNPVLGRFSLEGLGGHPVLGSIAAFFPLLLLLRFPQLGEDVAQHHDDAIEDHGLHEFLLEPIQEQGHQGRVFRFGRGSIRGPVGMPRAVRAVALGSVGRSVLRVRSQPLVVVLGQPGEGGRVLQREGFDVDGLLAEFVALSSDVFEEPAPLFGPRSFGSVLGGAGAVRHGQCFLDGFEVHPDAFQGGGDEPFHPIQFHLVLLQEGLPSSLVPLASGLVLHPFFDRVYFGSFYLVFPFSLLLPFHLPHHRPVPHVVRPELRHGLFASPFRSASHGRSVRILRKVSYAFTPSLSLSLRVLGFSPSAFSRAFPPRTFPSLGSFVSRGSFVHVSLALRLRLDSHTHRFVHGVGFVRHVPLSPFSFLPSLSCLEGEGTNRSTVATDPSSLFHHLRVSGPFPRRLQCRPRRWMLHAPSFRPLNPTHEREPPRKRRKGNRSLPRLCPDANPEPTPTPLGVGREGGREQA